MRCDTYKIVQANALTRCFHCYFLILSCWYLRYIFGCFLCSHQIVYGISAYVNKSQLLLSIKNNTKNPIGCLKLAFVSNLWNESGNVCVTFFLKFFDKIEIWRSSEYILNGLHKKTDTYHVYVSALQRAVIFSTETEWISSCFRAFFRENFAVMQMHAHAGLYWTYLQSFIYPHCIFHSCRWPQSNRHASRSCCVHCYSPDDWQPHCRC